MKKQQKLLNMMKNQTEKRPVDTLNLQTKNDDFSCDSSKYIYFRKWEAQAQFLGRRGNERNPAFHPSQADILDFFCIPNSPRRTPLLRPYQFTPEKCYNDGA